VEGLVKNANVLKLIILNTSFVSLSHLLKILWWMGWTIYNGK